MNPACSSPPTPPTARALGTHPLGPMLRWVRVEGWGGRLYAAGVLAVSGALLITAWRLQPGPRQMGTHQQLGLPPCGFLVITGLPCPTCGMTTAFSHTMHGEFLAAARSQLAGFILAVMTIGAALAGGVAVVSGVRPSLNWYRLNPLHGIWWAAAVFVLSWALKIGLGLLSGSLPQRGGW